MGRGALCSRRALRPLALGCAIPARLGLRVIEENRAEVNFELVERPTLAGCATSGRKRASRSARRADRGRAPAAADEEARDTAPRNYGNNSPPLAACLRLANPGSLSADLKEQAQSAGDWVDEPNAGWASGQLAGRSPFLCARQNQASPASPRPGVPPQRRRGGRYSSTQRRRRVLAPDAMASFRELR